MQNLSQAFRNFINLLKIDKYNQILLAVAEIKFVGILNKAMIYFGYYSARLIEFFYKGYGKTCDIRPQGNIKNLTFEVSCSH